MNEKAQNGECPTMCDDDCEARCHEWHQPPFKRDHRPESCERAQVTSPAST